ncbi:MAG: T9SS type A sorting domain-containing protein [Bacteroidota bacterium]|nr:T9SS type A sorting domain-containing protein [Bacteroidota bacterium]
MKILYTSLALLLVSAVAFGQNLLPAINSGILPANNDPVCSSPYYINTDFDTSGYDVGELVNDFTLFDKYGNGFQLSAVLSQGKPVLLIAGSLTCPVFRQQVADINAVYATYAAYINTNVIYTIEPHPTDTSPYSGNINVTNQNLNQGILYAQPTTYLQRKDLVDTLLQTINLNCPLYIDGPCNEWWHAYGPAPQNAYLIDTSGIVVLKHGWFNQFPNNIYCELDSVLGINSGLCNPSSGGGSFIFNPVAPVVYGSPGQSIYALGDLINISSMDVRIAVVKLQENYAPGWDASFCMSICYAATVDSTTILLQPNDTMHFSLDFFTSLNPDSSFVRVGFRNITFPNNQFTQWFSGYTINISGIEQASTTSFQLFPNPCATELHLHTSDAGTTVHEYFIYNVNGQPQEAIVQQNGLQEFAIDVSGLVPGVYFIEQRGQQKSSYSRFIKY